MNETYHGWPNRETRAFNTTDRLTALLHDEDCGCRVPDDLAHVTDYDELAAVLAAAGVGFVAEVQRERDEAQAAHEAERRALLSANRGRKRAETALADLRSRVRALAADANRAYHQRPTFNVDYERGYLDVILRLDALLGGGSDD